MPEKLYQISALVIRQWLTEWDTAKFSEKERRRKPDPYFYVFTMRADWLRRLSDIQRRKADRPRIQDMGIQRAHDPKRSKEIGRFIRGGFPWSDLSERQKQSDEYKDLQMPGWLPTAIIANIKAPGPTHGSLFVSDEDAIRIEHLGDNLARLILPEGFDTDSWSPPVYPIGIIDGQHRLWAFEGDEQLSGDYELPVVAFYNLDVTWQAYLFYTINIKPKRINRSLAFDLYPILRIQEWLERSPDGPAIYRETRAQELTEVLWSHPESPWQGRINMLGEKKGGAVTQAAFIRSLMASYVKRWEGRGISIGGLFGAELHADLVDVLQWNRPQQAAFLILVWQSMADAVAQCQAEWAKSLRRQPMQKELPLGARNADLDPAFISDYSLLATDQGARGILLATNDMCYVAADELGLSEWRWGEEVDEEVEEDTIGEPAVSQALQAVRQHPVNQFLQNIAAELSKFDWRTSSFPDFKNEGERRAQMVFRGSGGYKELRKQLIESLMSARDNQVRAVATEVWNRLGY